VLSYAIYISTHQKSVSLHDHLAALGYGPEHHPTRNGNTDSPVSIFGITTTPRISHESWQLFWGYFSDGLSSSSERRPPIAGRVEFDIDLQRARWYATWITSRHRELRDQPVHHIPSSAQSLAHYPGEGRSTVAHFPISEDYADEKTLLQQRIAPITRHIPKKLSLVERFDVLSARSDLNGNSFRFVATR